MILLDTCALLWLVTDSPRLSPTAREQLSQHRGCLFVSAISAFEIGIKHSKGKLRLPREPEAWFRAALEFHGLEEVAVSGRVAAISTCLPRLHADPADRMIVATAQIQGMTILTPDPLIRNYPDISTAW